MSSRMSFRSRTMLGAALAALAVLAGCGKGGAPSVGAADAAQKVYVAPGQYDEFYAFMSGGFSGQIGVYGLPSGRLLKAVPVFSQNPENGYGYSEQTKADAEHHLRVHAVGRLASSRAVHDQRRARRPLALHQRQQHAPHRAARPEGFVTAEILEIPNAAGNHASPFMTENTEYSWRPRASACRRRRRTCRSTRTRRTFAACSPSSRWTAPPGTWRSPSRSCMPGFNYDLSHSGKGPSHGWSFFTSYNSEEANTLLEVNASQKDKDYIAAVNWKAAEQCVAQGKAKQVPARYAHNFMGPAGTSRAPRWNRAPALLDAGGLPRRRVLPAHAQVAARRGRGSDRRDSSWPAASSPRSSRCTRSRKMLKAIEDKAFEGEVNGIPVLKYEATIAGEVKNPGLGPLHTEFDGKGNAYTSMFVSSEIVKWSLKDFKVLDRIPTYYSIGHLMIPGGDTRKPWGKYVVALNKITKDRYLPTGPELAQSAQLYRHHRRQDAAAAGLPDDRRAALRAGAAGVDADQGPDSRCTTWPTNTGPVRGARARRPPASAQGQRGPRQDDGDPQPLHARQHRGHPGGRLGLLPPHQPGAGLGRAARLRDDRHATTPSS